MVWKLDECFMYIKENGGMACVDRSTQRGVVEVCERVTHVLGGCEETTGTMCRHAAVRDLSQST